MSQWSEYIESYRAELKAQGLSDESIDALKKRTPKMPLFEPLRILYHECFPEEPGLVIRFDGKPPELHINTKLLYNPEKLNDVVAAAESSLKEAKQRWIEFYGEGEQGSSLPPPQPGSYVERFCKLVGIF
ncbi:MAG: hypothetical protein PWQ41_1464 [Bacillota bacterium]|jgi:hypothetical protein|nr:hypothetical protein [Bacillota bacterium]MDK2960675.1 hypothetical protein [Bacillota bacterium]